MRIRTSETGGGRTSFQSLRCLVTGVGINTSPPRQLSDPEEWFSVYKQTVLNPEFCRQKFLLVGNISGRCVLDKEFEDQTSRQGTTPQRKWSRRLVIHRQSPLYLAQPAADYVRLPQATTITSVGPRVRESAAGARWLSSSEQYWTTLCIVVSPGTSPASGPKRHFGFSLIYGRQILSPLQHMVTALSGANSFQAVRGKRACLNTIGSTLRC